MSNLSKLGPAHAAPISPTPETGAARRPVAPPPDGSSPAGTVPAKSAAAANVQGKLINKLAGQKKFEQAFRPLRANGVFSAMSADAAQMASQAQHDTDEALVEYHNLLDSAATDQHSQARKKAGSDEVLHSVEFELDCLTTLIKALDGLQLSDQLKLAAARKVVTEFGQQDPTLQPLLAQREQHAADCEQVRHIDRERAEHRIAQVIERLEQSGILALH